MGRGSGVGTAHGRQEPIRPPYPRHDPAVVEADDQLHPHFYFALHTLYQTDHVGRVLPGRHAIDHSHHARAGRKLGFEDQAIAAVATFRARRLVPRGCDQPATVARLPEQRSEARARVESRHTKPIDRSVPADQRSGSGIANQAVIFDRYGHGTSSQLGPRYPTFSRCVQGFGRCWRPIRAMKTTGAPASQCARGAGDERSSRGRTAWEAHRRCNARWRADALRARARPPGRKSLSPSSTADRNARGSFRDTQSRVLVRLTSNFIEKQKVGRSVRI